MATKRKLEKDIRCPLEYGLDVFGGRWKSRVIGALAFTDGLRYGELKASMPTVSHEMLSNTLKELIEVGIVLRTEYDEVVPHVEYALTEKGDSLIPILREICVWSVKYFPEIKETALDKCKNCEHVRPYWGVGSATNGTAVE